MKTSNLRTRFNNTLPLLSSLLLLLSASVLHAGDPSTARLIKQLQQGGYIIYLRHAATNRGQRDMDRNTLGDCSQQRNLSAQGRKQSARIGAAIKALDIPIGKVFTSPYCRCKDTAKLAFGNYRIDSNLQFSISKNRADSKRLGAHLRNSMLQANTRKTNAVFVGHTSNLRDGLGVWPKPEGVMVVFRKEGKALRLQGMIKPDDWASVSLKN